MHVLDRADSSETLFPDARAIETPFLLASCKVTPIDYGRPLPRSTPVLVFNDQVGNSFVCGG